MISYLQFIRGIFLSPVLKEKRKSRRDCVDVTAATVPHPATSKSKIPIGCGGYDVSGGHAQ